MGVGNSQAESVLARDQIRQLETRKNTKKNTRSDTKCTENELVDCLRFEPTINELVRSLLATIVPAARLSASLVHSQDSMARSSLDADPFNTIHFSGNVTERSPPALALGFSLSSFGFVVEKQQQQKKKLDLV